MCYVLGNTSGTFRKAAQFEGKSSTKSDITSSSHKPKPEGGTDNKITSGYYYEEIIYKNKFCHAYLM